MVDKVSENKTDDGFVCEPSVVDYLRLAEILIQAIPNDRKQMWAGKVMTYLATEALRTASQGQIPTRVPTKAIYSDLGGNPNQEPSAWLSPIWKEIEKRYYPEIEQSIIDLCRQAGLNNYSVIEKDNGKPAFYRLAAKQIPSSDHLGVGENEASPAGSIIYKRDLSLELSSFGKLFFQSGLIWTSFKRWSYLTWQLLFFIAAASFFFLIWLILWNKTQPITGQDLVLVAMGIGFPWAAHSHFSGVFRLFEDRIVIAPEWMLAWKEVGATLEINRSKDPDGPSTLLVQRYSAQCPICGFMVKLDKGDPDFPRRVIGRCEDNPREHVFSFDRSTKIGKFIRDSTDCYRL